jgi:hypothetical protein
MRTISGEDALPMSDRDLDLSALLAVREAEGGYPSTYQVQRLHEGALPVQRLNGLRRRGLLRFANGYWHLTEEGSRRAAQPRRESHNRMSQ